MVLAGEGVVDLEWSADPGTGFEEPIIIPELEVTSQAHTA